MEDKNLSNVVALRVDNELLCRIDEYANRRRMTRSSALRELVESGLENYYESPTVQIPVIDPKWWRKS